MLKQLKLTKTSASLTVILCFVLLVFIPLYPKLPAIEVPQTHVRIRLEDFVVFFALLASLPLCFQKREKILKEPIGQAIVIYWLVGLASTISALLITRLIWPHLTLLHFLRRIEYMVLFFLGFLAIRNKKDFRVFLIALFLVVGAIFLYALGQKFFSLPAIMTMDEEFSKGTMIKLDVWTRVSATFAGHYDLAIFMTMVIPLILSTALVTKNKTKKIILLLLFIACYYLLVLTASRVSFVAYLASVSFLFIILNKKWWLPPVIALSLLGSFFSEDINQRFSATIRVEGPRLVQKIDNSISSLLPKREEKKIVQVIPTPTPTIIENEEREGEEETVSGSSTGKKNSKPTPKPTPPPPPSRQEVAEIGVERSGDIRFGVEWPRAIRHFKKNPLLGTGYSSITLATDNGYLRALGETGLLGFLSLITIFLTQIPFYHSVLKRSNKNWWLKFLTAAMASATLAVLASMLFIDALESSKVAFTYWLILGLIAGRVNLEKDTV